MTDGSIQNLKYAETEKNELLPPRGKVRNNHLGALSTSMDISNIALPNVQHTPKSKGAPSTTKNTNSMSFGFQIRDNRNQPNRSG